MNLAFPYPVEDAFGGWDPTTEPCPLFALLSPASVANFANTYALFMDQDAYSNGVWQFTDDPANEPPVFVFDPCDTSEHGYTYVGARIALASVLQDLYGDLVCAVNGTTGNMFYSAVTLTTAVFTVYTSDIDVTQPPTQIDGITPLTDLTSGFNVPILLTAQTDPNENGFWFATPNRATRSTLRDKPATIPDPVVSLIGDDGDLATTGSWWVNVPGTGWVAYEGVTDHGALTGLADDDHTQYALADGTRGDFAALLHAASHQDGGTDELALDASQTTTGVFDVARLGTGTPSAFTFLDGTGAWTDNVPVYVPVKNTSGSQIDKGAPVYATGTVGATYVIEIAPADADVAAAMPALGLLESTLAVNATGYAVITGTLRGVDTTAYTVGQELYVSTTAGQLTGTRPTGSTAQVQSIGVVTRVNSNNGEILVGIGHVAEAPNSGIDGGAITTGTVGVARLGSGTPSSANFLRGDGSWQTLPGVTVDVVSNVASGRILGRTSSGSGDSEELTDANVRTFLKTPQSSDDSVLDIRVLTQAAYDALTPVATTLYFING